MDPQGGIRLSSAGTPTAVGATWSALRWIVGVVLLAGLAGALLAACIVEGCTFPYEAGDSDQVQFRLDADHPVGTTWIEVSLTADALPGDVEDRGARLQLTLSPAQDVTLTVVPDDGNGEPVALIASDGKASLPLDQCRPDEPCIIRALAVVEWTSPRPTETLPVGLTVEGLVRVPHTKDKCGLPGDVVAVTLGPALARPAAANGGVGGARHDATELRQHVTVRFGAGLPTSGEDVNAVGPGSVIVRGHIGLDPDADVPAVGASATVVPGIWLRVTPDSGTPILDGPVPLGYPVLPADATFPIEASCARPCERGYWIEAAVYDPANRTWGDPATAVYGWSFDASVSASELLDASDASLTVTLDDGETAVRPAPLVLHGTGDPFRVDGEHEKTTLAIDVGVPARPAAPFGDGLADATITFQLTTVAVDSNSPGTLFLSNGHYLGDGSTGDDDADRGAWGGPGTNSSPPGRPFAACAGVTDACATRTGLVLGRYDSVFDNGATPPFEVQWEWSLVGAPPGATVTVTAVKGETIDVPTASTLTAPIALVALLVTAGLAMLVIRSSKRRRTDGGPATSTDDALPGS